MRNPSIAFAQALAEAPARGLVARRLIYINAVTRDLVPEPAPIGFWTGDRSYQIQVMSGQTGELETRPYIGMGSKLKIPPIPRTSDLSVQTIQVQLSHLDPYVQTMIRENNTRFAKVDIHEALFDPTTKMLIGSELVFIGEVDGDPINTASAKGIGNAVLSVVSDAIRTLTEPNPKKRSNETMIQRNPTDDFSKYSNTIENFDIQWGER